MKKTVKNIVSALLLGCFMVACTQNAPDLTGSWTQKTDTDTYMTADITADTITVYWTYAEDDSKALYWAGTFEAPTTGGTYTWDSVNDHDKTDSAILASSGDTKTFTYADGGLSFDVTALGVTKTITLEKDK